MQMAVRRELVKDERGGFAAADKLTPEKKSTQLKAEIERRRGRAVAANPLGDPPVLLAAARSSSYAFIR